MAEGYIICRGFDDLESWKADIKTKYTWSTITAGTPIIFQFGNQMICYAEGSAQ